MVDQDSENDISAVYDEGIDVEDTRGIKTFIFRINFDQFLILT